jgi:uncharacterized membrane protein
MPSHRFRILYLLTSIVAIGALLRFYTIGAKTVWLDEAFSIWIANHKLWELWTWLIRIDHHPPLYYTLLHGWQLLFGDLQGAVRSLSALCGVLTIPVFYAATRRFFDSTTGLIAAFILALSPFHVRFAQEARMYTLLTLAVALVLYFVAQVLMEQPIGKRRILWFGLGAAQAAVMLTHNTATLLFPLALNLPVLGALYFARRRNQPSSFPALNSKGFLRWWLISQLLAIVLWLPWAIPFLVQAQVVDREFWLWPPTVQMVYEAFHNFNFVFLPSWFPGLPAWDILYWLLALLGVLSMRRTPARMLLLLSLFLTPIIGELLVSLRRPLFYDRTLIWTTLPYYMLVAIGIRSLGRLALRTFRRRAYLPAVATQAICMMIIAVLSSFSLWSYYVYFEKEEWAKAADYIAQHVGRDELVLFNASWVQIPFEYYFRHYSTGADLRGLPVDLFQRGVLEPKMTEADVPYLNELLTGHDRVWLVYSHDWYTDPHQIIPRQLDARMRLVDHQEFVGLQVMEFQAESHSDPQEARPVGGQ